MGEKKSKPKPQVIRSVVLGALPPLACLLRSDNQSKPGPPSAGINDSDWDMVTPIIRSKSRDFPLLPALTSSYSRALGSLVSAFKGIPNIETWPMTSDSVGISQMEWDLKTHICVPVTHLDSAWDSLPGSGGLVKTLEWHRDTSGVGHESVVLEVDVVGGPFQTWYVCVERYPDGDFATISPNKSRLIRATSETRAEMEFPDGLPFAHVLRILAIIQLVSPNYFLVGSNCWFYASMIVEMLDLAQGPTQTKAARWTKGGCLKSTDHFVTKELNSKQHFEIEQRVRDLVSHPKKSISPGSWCNILMTCGSGDTYGM
ncbi:hypothetical protein ACGC1H_006347 [Rhizoctonia solani]|uniref:Uncharacterized protein n=1 Tax=Rhizoctonia solani TaxID=456999 RepID=A0A8H3C4W2_9AGAM|nr:unnamed protein product [Rhizoctonia solani]